MLPRAGMCRAHGIAHQRVSERGELRGALAAAWSLNRHSVVEVVAPPGAANVAHHKALQEAVRRAVLRALCAVSPAAGTARTCTQPPDMHAGSHGQLCMRCRRPGSQLLPVCHSQNCTPTCRTGAIWAKIYDLRVMQGGYLWLHAGAAAATRQPQLMAAPLRIAEATYHSYALPLRLPLTTTAPAAADGRQGLGCHRGFYLHLQVQAQRGSGSFAGIGEIAPLPGELLCQCSCVKTGSSPAHPRSSMDKIPAVAPVQACPLLQHLKSYEA